MEKKEAEFYSGGKNESEKSKAQIKEKEKRKKIMLTAIIGGFIVLVFLLVLIFKKRKN